VETCIGAGLVGGEGFVVDASLIEADATASVRSPPVKGLALFAYADNYLIDVQYGVIVDVEASRAFSFRGTI
jgi:hypothetical protein